MRVTGKITNIAKNIVTNKYDLTLETNENYIIEEQLDNIKDLEILDIQLEKHKRRRSLTSNAYCWVLLQRIAEATQSTKEIVYKTMLERYGQFTFLITKEKSQIYLTKYFPIVKKHGEIKVGKTQGTQYQVYFGSSTYNQVEMNHFLNGIVSEAKELGVETLTPRELEALNKQWKGD